MPRLFIFNPETDFALAAGRHHYSPPAVIREFSRDMQLVQSLIASKGDAILVTDDFNEDGYAVKAHLEAVELKGITLVTRSRLRSFMHTDGIRIIPWGWNHTLRHELIASGIPDSMLPAEDYIDSVRLLSHRRTCIPFQKRLAVLLPSYDIPVAKEFESVADCMGFLLSEEEVYFKSPWSSSGRGVISSRTLTPERIEAWVGGCIKRQGSVMAERGWKRKADFATEWILDNGRARFIGLSLFNTSSQGRYSGNSKLSQDEIDSYLREMTTTWNEGVILAQQAALEELVAPTYAGPAGIDMLVSESGRINPCVEINLRMTMGIISLGYLPHFQQPSCL